MAEVVKGKFYFQVTKNKERMALPLEALDLPTRSFNSLKRADINTVGDLVAMMENLRTEDNLLKAGRNIGKNSAHEIMEALWTFEKGRHGTLKEQEKFVEEVKANQNKLMEEMWDIDPRLVQEEISRRKAATVNRAQMASFARANAKKS